ncbi:mycofactocin biosynthesis glycosyltransferase MftF, partial [Jatrophihabitans sp.]|uniref:mycofactocin biosynthesis glycosyltransferase MftF n=1 Tax=Jatrophihabitans sp. TaxID=1932789 RepID=UPI0030C7491B|nr:mftF [Jatrophihabitans sp.]
ASGRVRSPAGARLARQLTDVGLVHPSWPAAALGDVTVVIPIRDRPDELDRCLTALDAELPVIVVDDASADPHAVAAVCASHGARLVVRAANGGPAAARNTGLAHVETDFVLFLDSDTVPAGDVVAQLGGHFGDPLVAAVAPRITTLPGPSAPVRYGMAASSLDLGRRQARVAPGGGISYVPTAALLVRRAALDDVGGFEVSLRFGEDVDLVWRLDAAGWRVRYEPSVTVQHAEPTRWWPLLQRRYRYGTAAGPLARRHRGNLAPLVLHCWSGVAVLGLLARRPSIALAGLVASTVALQRTLGEVGVESTGAATEAMNAAGQTWRQVGRTAAQFGLPLVVAAAVPGGRRARGRRLALAGLLLAAPVADWRAGPRTLGPVRFAVARVIDDAAYGSGVVAGSVRARTAEPLTPRLVRRLLRIAPPALHAVPSERGPVPAASIERSTNA